jgi:peptidoglycan hydrolase-like protein with peptidoglycan-binding domain
VSGIQARLNNLGYNCGKVDGIFGKKTRAALNLFRKTVGLPLSAKIDAAATSKLEEVHDLGHVEQCRADEPDQPGDAMEEGI